MREYSISTPLGLWRATFSDLGLRELRLPSPSTAPSSPRLRVRGAAALQRLALRTLNRRLNGERVDLPWACFDLQDQPPFYLRVWKALYAIPFGEVRSYAQIASAAGSPRAARAVGQACGANPIVLFIPCHRAVATNGPGGFGAGLAWKRRLLQLEGYALGG